LLSSRPRGPQFPCYEISRTAILMIPPLVQAIRLIWTRAKQNLTLFFLPWRAPGFFSLYDNGQKLEQVRPGLVSRLQPGPCSVPELCWQKDCRSHPWPSYLASATLFPSLESRPLDVPKTHQSRLSHRGDPRSTSLRIGFCWLYPPMSIESDLASSSQTPPLPFFQLD